MELKINKDGAGRPLKIKHEERLTIRRLALVRLDVYRIFMI